MVKNPKKIFIVGAPGSGKTTLAAILSKKLGCPHYDLDDIRYPPGKPKRTDEEAIPIVKKLISKPVWILEGVYLSWLTECLDETDLIIWLDVPFHICLYRITMRYFKNLLKGKTRYGFKSTLLLIKNLTRYYYPKPGTELDDVNFYVTRQKVIQELSNYKERLIQIKNNQDLKKLLSDLSHT